MNSGLCDDENDIFRAAKTLWDGHLKNYTKYLQLRALKIEIIKQKSLVNSQIISEKSNKVDIRGKKFEFHWKNSWKVLKIDKNWL